VAAAAFDRRPSPAAKAPRAGRAARAVRHGGAVGAGAGGRGLGRRGLGRRGLGRWGPGRCPKRVSRGHRRKRSTWNAHGRTARGPSARGTAACGRAARRGGGRCRAVASGVPIGPYACRSPGASRPIARTYSS
jgi:hypothetical protein